MSSTIRDHNHLREQEISGLKKQIARERRALDEIHQKNKTDIKTSQEQEIVEIRDDHAQTINEAYQRREKVLAELERNLNQTKNLTDKQLSEIRRKTKEQENQIEDTHAHKRLLLNANNEQHLQEVNHRYNTQLKKTNTEGENRIQSTKEALALRHAGVQHELQDKIQKTSNHYTSELSRQEQDYKNNSAIKEKEYKQKQISLRQTHENKIVEQSEINQDLYQKRDVNFKNKFHQQDKFFEKKFENQLSSHNSQLQGLDTKFEDLSTKMKQDLMTQLEAVEKKENDIFFEFTELNSQVKDQGDHYTVEVEIPDYAKKHLNLTTNNKEIILTLNRRYQDQVDKDGVKHKVNKVETLSSRIPTDHFLNSKKMTSNYQDGLMSYKIFKA